MRNHNQPIAMRYDVNMSIDHFLNDPEHVKEIEESGCKVVPVDVNRSFVPTDKYDENNLNETEENIRNRFGL
jgi:hypothetical protein